MRKLGVVLMAMVVGCSFGTVLALDPNDKGDAMRDVDSDLLPNIMEFIYGTDPNNPDTDNGGVTDGWEAYYDANRARFDANSEWARFDADGDGANDVNVDPNYKIDPTCKADEKELADEDGWDLIREYKEGTDPTNPDTDGDDLVDDQDPFPLIPREDPGPGGGGNSGLVQGTGMAPRLATAWNSGMVRGL